MADRFKARLYTDAKIVYHKGELVLHANRDGTLFSGNYPTKIIPSMLPEWYLKKMVDYDLNDYATIDGDTKTKTPLLNSIPHGFYRKGADRHQNVQAKLTDPRFESLKANDRYQRLINMLNK